MIDPNYCLENGRNFDTVHRRHIFRMTGTANHKGTVTDNICKYLDQGYFTTLQELEEQDRALDIDEAKGLELDDLYGDKYGINRNGMNDELYRFILKSHALVNSSNGSLPSLIRVVANLLGCNDDDVRFVNARDTTDKRIKNDPDTIVIKDINVNNVNNPALLPYITDQLNHAVAAGKHVKAVDFYAYLPTNVNTGITCNASAMVKINFPKDIQESRQTQQNVNVGLTNNVTERVKF